MKKIFFVFILSAAFLLSSCGGSESATDIPECVENQVFPCIDAVSGLSWSEKTSHSKIWSEAVFYCENLEEGGIRKWRLPNIDELRTLVQECSGTVTGGECHVSHERGCLSYDSCWSRSCLCELDESGKYSKFGDLGGLWSSSETGDEGAWHIDFYEAKIVDVHKQDSYAVRCVK
ncbi:DUF1566 domain-containing protein [bacterium]|nr:DUF1566 domain-containing protein [bacterium]MBP5591550.1 DUF1566 domain-containing protein [bacterium]